MDIYRYIRRKASVKELMVIGRSGYNCCACQQYDLDGLSSEWVFCCRLFVIIMVVISILWIPVINEMQGGQLYIYIQSVCAYLAPPIASVYCMSILWPRANEKVGVFLWKMPFFSDLMCCGCCRARFGG